MALKDILLHVDTSKSTQARTAAAIRLATQHDAHIVGLFTIFPLSLPPYVANEFPADVLEMQKKRGEKEMQEAKQKFESLISIAGISNEWRVEHGLYEQLLCEHARYVDLLILGQRDPDDAMRPSDASPDSVILKSGRPAIIVPYIGIPENFPERALIAWNGKRESLRAINDALPILQKCSFVKVASFIEEAEKAEAISLSEKDIIHHLGRHGVDAQAEIVNASGLDIGNALLSFVADEVMDLLVMGCYGHSRFRELLLGGVTKRILAEMTIPVLMSR